jgi:hypothetical protein
MRLIVLFVGFTLALAGVTFCQSDTLGSVFNAISKALPKDAILAQLAILAWTGMSGLIGYALTRFMKWALNKAPTTWYWNAVTKKFVVKWYWQLAATFFGKSALYYNAVAEKDEFQPVLDAKIMEKVVGESVVLRAGVDALKALKNN